MPTDNLQTHLHRWELLHAAHWGFAPSDRLYLLGSCPDYRSGLDWMYKSSKGHNSDAHTFYNRTAPLSSEKHGKVDRQIPRMVKNCVIRARRWKLFRRLFKYGCTWDIQQTVIVWERKWKTWQYRLSFSNENKNTEARTMKRGNSMQYLEVYNDEDEGRNEWGDQMRRRSIIDHHQQGCEDKLAQHLHNLFIFVSGMGTWRCKIQQDWRS